MCAAEADGGTREGGRRGVHGGAQRVRPGDTARPLAYHSAAARQALLRGPRRASVSAAQ